jgi:cell division protein ZipA
MPELRWTLLILGALFIGGLAIWEWRRKKHVRGQQLGQPRDGERLAPTLDQAFDNSGDAPRGAAPEKQRGDTRMFREPTFTLPDEHADGRDRTPISDPRVVELDDASLAELKVDRQEVVDEFSGSGRQADAGLDEELPEEDVEPISAREGEAREGTLPAMSAAEIAFNDEVFQQEQEEQEDSDEQEGREDQEDPEEQEEPEPAVAPRENGFAVAGPAAEPVVEWPDEDSRKIIALRLVSGAGERFAGRAVRLALAAEGFLPGKFDIFHKPGPDSRAVLSAASLTKPGTFAVSTMDAQRYGGLSLFAVLPGPLPPVATFDELLVTARSLNDRLRGALQDERGEPLTPMRSANIRDSLSAAAASQTHDSSPA